MRAAVIGTGKLGSSRARALSRIGALAAVCDVAGDTATRRGRVHGANSYASIDALLASEEFDVAFVCTPITARAEAAGSLIRAGKSVLVESPPTCLPHEVEELAEQARRRKVRLWHSRIDRFNPAVQKTADLIGSRSIGALATLKFERWDSALSHDTDGKIAYGSTVHDMETAAWLFGSMPGMIFSMQRSFRSEHENYADTVMDFKDGRAATISSHAHNAVKSHALIAVCEMAIIRADLAAQSVMVEISGRTEAASIHAQDPLQAETESFLTYDGWSEKDLQEAINSVRMAEAALLSGQCGTSIYLEMK